MRIAMFTNTYLPHVGGVARSTSTLVNGLRRAGHEVLVVAPRYDDSIDPRNPTDPDLVRVAAVQNFAGSDFAMPLPISTSLEEWLDDFDPHIIHSHHPFLLGDTALRAAAGRELPIVFTYHTRYELYGHYVAGDTAFMRRMIRSMSAGYCNLCDAVIAPSLSIADHLRSLNVETPIDVVASGIEPSDYSMGEGTVLRRELGIPEEAFVVGHVGRLAKEKNLGYLTDALTELLQRHPCAYALFAGDGAMRDEMQERFEEAGLAPRALFLGVVTGRMLADVYDASDVFAFASHSETQGLVLAEAMTAGLPVVALDAPGAREVVDDGRNGRLLTHDAPASAFVDALEDMLLHHPEKANAMRPAALAKAAEFTIEQSVEKTVAVYRRLLAEAIDPKNMEEGEWTPARRVIEEELQIIGNVIHSIKDAVLIPDPVREDA